MDKKGSVGKPIEKRTGKPIERPPFAWWIKTKKPGTRP